LEAAFAASYFARCHWDCIVAADAGLRVCDEAGIMPGIIVGDFDSLMPRRDGKKQDLSGMRLLEKYEKAGVTIRRFRPEKDDTDTQIAVEAAMERGCTQIHVLGGTGTRLDHMLGNLQVMEMALNRGAAMILVDVHNRVTMHNVPFVISKAEQWGGYISFIPWGGDVAGLTLRGFKYPLEGAVLSHAVSLGISNELAQDVGEVSMAEGKLIMVEAADG